MKLARRASSRQPAAPACEVAVVFTAVHGGRRHLLMIVRARSGEWTLPARASVPGEDSARTAARALAEDAGITVALEACQPRPARPVGSDLPGAEPGDAVIPVLVPLGNVDELPRLAVAGSAARASWFPVSDCPSLYDALEAAQGVAAVSRAHAGLLSGFLGFPGPPGPDDRPDLVADFIRLGYAAGALDFLVECRAPETFTAAVMATPAHSGFRPDAVARELGGMLGEFTHASVGREAGPVIYLHLPFFENQRQKNAAALAAAAADLSLTGGQPRISRRDTDALIARAARAGRRLGAREAGPHAGPLASLNVVCDVRLWWR